MNRILFVLPYAEMELLVKQCFKEISYLKEEEIRYDIRLAEIDGELEIEQGSADIVIARGITAELIKTSIPKIELTSSSFDMMRAVRECIKKYHVRKIAFIGTPGMIYGVDSINEIMDDVQVSCFYAHTSDETEDVLDKLPAEAVIGGRYLGSAAERRNIPYVRLQSGKERIYHAMEEAIIAIKASGEEKEKREYLQALMDYSFEGIISTDINGRILVANQYACEYLGGGQLCGSFDWKKTGTLFSGTSSESAKQGSAV